MVLFAIQWALLLAASLSGAIPTVEEPSQIPMRVSSAKASEVRGRDLADERRGRTADVRLNCRNEIQHDLATKGAIEAAVAGLVKKNVGLRRRAEPDSASSGSDLPGNPKTKHDAFDYAFAMGDCWCKRVTGVSGVTASCRLFFVYFPSPTITQSQSIHSSTFPRGVFTAYPPTDRTQSFFTPPYPPCSCTHDSVTPEESLHQILIENGMPQWAKDTGVMPTQEVMDYYRDYWMGECEELAVRKVRALDKKWKLQQQRRAGLGSNPLPDRNDQTVQIPGDPRDLQEATGLGFIMGDCLCQKAHEVSFQSSIPTSPFQSSCGHLSS